MKIYFVLLCYLPCLLVVGKVLRTKQAKATVDDIDIIDIDNLEDVQEINSSGDDVFSSGSEDDEDEIASGDGTTASLPVLSACQAMRKDANKNLIGVYIPRCAPDGHFEPVQCHGGTAGCWCVDKSGRELHGTRRMAEKIKCNGTDVNANPPIIVVQSRRPPNSAVSEEISTPAMKSTSSPSTSESHSDNGFTLIQSTQEAMEPDNRLDPIPNEPSIDVGPADMETNDINSRILPEPRGYKMPRSSIFNQPGILAGIIGGAVVGLLCAVLLVMFIAYHMRKKDSDPVFMIDRPSRSPSKSGYTKALDKEMYT